jgi:hypothetical protein
MNIDKLHRAIDGLDLHELSSLLPAAETFLRESPDFSAQLLSRLFRALQSAEVPTARGDEAERVLAPYVPHFEALVRHGASVNTLHPIEDLPPLFVALQLSHHLFAERLIELGADVFQVVSGITLDLCADTDPAKQSMLAVARRAAARGEREA